MGISISGLTSSSRVIQNGVSVRFLMFNLILFFASAAAFSQDSVARSASDTLYIKEIIVQGNERTHADIIKYYLKIDTGMVFDTILLSDAKKRLNSTELFSKVDIISLAKSDGVHVYVILVEGFPYNVYDIGGILPLQISSKRVLVAASFRS